jgi:hypothetical protein
MSTCCGGKPVMSVTCTPQVMRNGRHHSVPPSTALTLSLNRAARPSPIICVAAPSLTPPIAQFPTCPSPLLCRAIRPRRLTSAKPRRRCCTRRRRACPRACICEGGRARGRLSGLAGFWQYRERVATGPLARWLHVHEWRGSTAEQPATAAAAKE